jgi:dihydrofolate synthase/folylpolyglutamate synthase
MKFGLETISRLCAALAHPEQSFTPVLIAGTNGKGSVTAMVHRGLREAGLHAARYTSPHLERLEERYVIGDREVETAPLRHAIARIRDTVESLQRQGAFDTPPTFFECATAVAFDLFREARVEVAVLEVGLGGRLDATNVVVPVVTAITSIGFDHEAQLGDSLESIAFEKAGIVRAGVPLICGALPDAAGRVIAGICGERGAPLVHASECGDLEQWIGSTPLALAGRHQRGNAAVAACVLRALGAAGAPVTGAAIRAGLTDVSWPARLERISLGSAEVLLDAAHNPDGARALAAYLRDIGWAGCGALVFGAMHDKAVAGMLEALAPVCQAVFCTTADSPRALSAEAIAGIARRTSSAWGVTAIADPGLALDTATRQFPRVVVAGSIFLTGPVRGILRAR